MVSHSSTEMEFADSSVTTFLWESPSGKSLNSILIFLRESELEPTIQDIKSNFASHGFAGDLYLGGMAGGR